MTRPLSPAAQYACAFHLGAESEARPVADVTEDLLEAAVREHSQLVFRIAYVVLRNRQDAEDATQETFMRAVRYRRKLEGIRNAKSWFARIAWRVAIGRHRERKISLSEIESDKAIGQLRSQLISAEECALGKELWLLFSGLIASLPEPLRDALRLSALDELSPAEIAEILGVSESSVRARIFRARHILKEKLAALEARDGTPR